MNAKLKRQKCVRSNWDSFEMALQQENDRLDWGHCCNFWFNWKEDSGVEGFFFYFFTFLLDKSCVDWIALWLKCRGKCMIINVCWNRCCCCFVPAQCHESRCFWARCGRMEIRTTCCLGFSHGAERRVPANPHGAAALPENSKLPQGKRNRTPQSVKSITVNIFGENLKQKAFNSWKQSDKLILTSCWFIFLLWFQH